MDDATGELLEVVSLGASAECKSQHESRRQALSVLYSKLTARVRDIRSKARGDRRVESSSFGGGGKERIRTYHEPDDRVTDLSGFQMSYRQTTGAGKIGPLIDKRRERVILGSS